jgi:hypothetical protein
MRSAKIVCTLGPASDSVEEIESLAKAGMSVARLNASHGSPEHRRTLIDRIHEVDTVLVTHLLNVLGRATDAKPGVNMQRAVYLDLITVDSKMQGCDTVSAAAESYVDILRATVG